MRYFRVTCRQGHHGNRCHQPITFAFEAENAISAMDLAKAMPSVKHSALVISCDEISYSDYMKLRRVSAYKRVEERTWQNLNG